MLSRSCGMWDLVSWSGIKPRHPSMELGVLASRPKGRPHVTVNDNMLQTFSKTWGQDKGAHEYHFHFILSFGVGRGTEQTLEARYCPPPPPWPLCFIWPHCSSRLYSKVLELSELLFLLSYFTLQVSYSFTCWYLGRFNSDLDWKRSGFILIPKKGNAKECSSYCTIALSSYASKVILKILQAKLQQYMSHELPHVQAGFRKGRGTRHQIANICWNIEKTREFQKNIYFCFIDYTKAFDCVDHNKLENS